MNGYALLDEEGGWLVNIIVWNGNLQDWQPPAGTIAKRIEEVDISQLPERPEDAI